MSVTEPMLNIYPSSNHHAQLHHESPLANGETSSTTSSESDVQLKGQNGSLSPMDNGPDMYTSDGSLDSQGHVAPPQQYVNGPPIPANSCPTNYIEYDPTMDGTNANYVPMAGPDSYDASMDYPSPGQEYVNQELYQSQGTEYVDYNQGQGTTPQQQQLPVEEGVPPGQGQVQGPEEGAQVQTQGQKQKYVFYLQIKAGEAFPVENGDQVQYIHGPTLVQLLSNSPTPPPIHMVKTGHGPVQSMANNIPLQAPAPMQTMPMQPPVPQDGRDAITQAAVYQNNQGPGTVPPVPQQMYQQPPMFQGPPPGSQGVYPHHMLSAYPNAQSMPPHMPPHLPTVFMGTGVHATHMHIQRFPGSCPTNHQHQQAHQGSNGDLSPRQENAHRPAMARSRSRDERADKQREKLQKKLRDRQKDSGGGGHGSHSSSPQTSPRAGLHSHHGAQGMLRPMDNNGTNSRGGSRKKRPNGMKDDIEEDPLTKKLKDLLSSITAPEVEQVSARSASVRWQVPETCHMGQGDEDVYEDWDLAAIGYKLRVIDKSKNTNPVEIYSKSPHYPLADLRPATEYQVSVSAILDGVHGALSPSATFETHGCPPDVPAMPRLSSRTKNYLILSWKAPNPNGSKIHSYLLQCDKGNGSSGYVAIYEGCDKQYKITKLQPSTLYRFRLQAINSHGSSGFSEEARFYTAGSVPPVPEPPSQVDTTPRSIRLQWQRGQGDIQGYILEMDDEAKRYGFQVVYRGDDTSHCCKNLARNSDYKFRLCAFNEEGNSRWSSIVAFRTTPDAPRAPSKPSLKGKLHSTSFKVTWDPPRDCGGSEIISYLLEKSDVRNGPFSVAYRGMEREFQFDGLKPGSSYCLRAGCVSRGGTSPWSDVLSVTTLPVIPGQCHPPRVHGKPKATSVNLRWGMLDSNGGALITEFSVEMTAAESSVASEVHRASADAMECSVTGLLPGRTYDFRLRAANRVGYGPYSEPLRVCTGAGPPDAPTELTASCVSTSIILLSWQKPCLNGADITEYRVEKASENGTFSLAYSGSATTCEIRTLQPATYYYLRVQALNAAGHGPFSSVATCQTLPSSPEAVPSLRVVSSTSDSLLIQWTEPSNCGSEIIAYNLDIGEGQPTFVEGNVTQYCVDQLEPDTKYRIRVQALNSIGEGPYSAVLKAMTRALPPTPPRLECIYYSHQSLKLKWGDLNRAVGDAKSLNFTLEMEDKRGRFMVVYCGVNVSHKVTRLTESTTYKFRILASNEAGTGPLSEDFVFATTKAPPVTLKAPQVEVDQDSCQITWGEAVLHQQNDLMIYQCQYQRTREGEARVIYRGPERVSKLNSLELNVEHRFRVCAIRCSGDGSSELQGVYSNWAPCTISPPSPREEHGGAGATDGDGEGAGETETKPLQDSQLAMIMMAGICFAAIVIAVVLQWYVGS